MLLECQEPCIINGGNTAKDFKLQKGAQRSYPVTTYLFILCLEIVFNLIFEHTYFHSAYADDTNFSLRHKRSI